SGSFARRCAMHGSKRAFALWALPMAAWLLAGCSMSPGSRLTLFPSNNRLLDAAKDLRAEQAADLPRELEKQVLAPYTVEPSDVLFITLTELDTPVRLPGDQPILLDGTINLGQFGQIVV